MNDFIDLRRVFAIVLSRWWMLALAILIGAGLGYGVARRQAKVYQATTTLLVGQIANSSDLTRQDIMAGDLMAKTYKEMIGREPVLQGVVDTLDLNLTWPQLGRRVKASLVEGTQLLQISVEANSPDSARIVADEVARQLMLFGPTVVGSGGNEVVEPFVQQQLDSLQSRIESGRSRVAALEEEMQSTDSAERLSELQAEVNGLESLITDWENNYTQLLAFLNSGQSADQLSVVEAARANPNPIRPQVQIYVMVATALAVLSTLGLIFSLEYFNNTVRTPEEVMREFGLPVLGNIDDTRQSGANKKSAYAYRFLLSPLAEAYRSLRVNLEMVGAGKDVKSIVITSCDAGVGKSSLAANLAAFLAQAGKRVILVDADLRKPSLHEVMNLSNGVGLSNLLGGRVSISKALQPPKGDRLRVITAGAPQNPQNGKGHGESADLSPMMMGASLELDPSEILGSEKVDRILAKLEEDSDVVLLDSPPFIVSDALILASKVDGVLLIIQPGRTQRKSVADMLEQLNRADARVLGVVLNHISTGNAKKMNGLPYPAAAQGARGHRAKANGNGSAQETQDVSRGNRTGFSALKASFAGRRGEEHEIEAIGTPAANNGGRNGGTAGQAEGTGDPNRASAIVMESSGEQNHEPSEAVASPGGEAEAAAMQPEADSAQPGRQALQDGAEDAPVDLGPEPAASGPDQSPGSAAQNEVAVEPTEATDTRTYTTVEGSEPDQTPSDLVQSEIAVELVEAPATAAHAAGDGSGGETESPDLAAHDPGDLTDEQWERIRTLLPAPKSHGGRNGLDDRTVLDAVLWKHRTGAHWPALPERYGKHEMVYSRYRRWQKEGTWERIRAELESGPVKPEHEAQDGGRRTHRARHRRRALPDRPGEGG